MGIPSSMRWLRSTMRRITAFCLSRSQRTIRHVTKPIWEREAENWVRWARQPGHDAYWSYRDSFFEEVVPAAGRHTLEIGCGEGRVSRDLAARGHRVSGVDLSPILARHARDADEH